MNATEAINKIADLLGMKFKSEKFFVTKLVDGATEITNGRDDAFQVGDELFIVEDSIMKPAPSGVHETREGIVLEVDEAGRIVKISEKPESEEEERVAEAETDIEIETEVMSRATLTDGTVIETDEEGDFQVGQKLFVITQEGDKVTAPEGEHTTESGIVVTVNAEGIITGVKYPDESGEGSLEAARKQMKEMKEAMSSMLSLMQNYSKDLESIKKDYEEFKKSPAFSSPVVKKSFAKENILDQKIAFLKNAMAKK
jgi:flagellar basal body rod protein FlgG